MDIQDVEQAFGKWIHLDEDPLLVRILFSCILANRYDSDPVWLLVIGPAGSGKTLLLTAIAGSDTCEFVNTLTPYALASGHGDGSDSLLFRLDQRILIVEDMSSVTEMDPAAKSMLFSFLRSAYNGKFTRVTGRSTIDWSGKFGLLGGATPAIESGRRMESSLGERFLSIRPRVNMGDQDALLDRVLTGSAHKSQMRDELSDCCQKFLGQPFDTSSRSIKRSTVAILKKCAIALSRLRTGAVRDRFSREIEFPLEVGEMGTRLFSQFVAIALAAHAIGTPWDDVERIVMRIMLDSVPYVRVKMLRGIRQGLNEPRLLNPHMMMAASQVGRHVEELKYLGMISHDKGRRWVVNDDVVAHALDNEA